MKAAETCHQSHDETACAMLLRQPGPANIKHGVAYLDGSDFLEKLFHMLVSGISGLRQGCRTSFKVRRSASICCCCCCCPSARGPTSLRQCCGNFRMRVWCVRRLFIWTGCITLTLTFPSKSFIVESYQVCSQEGDWPRRCHPR